MNDQALRKRLFINATPTTTTNMNSLGKNHLRPMHYLSPAHTGESKPRYLPSVYDSGSQRFQKLYARGGRELT